MLLPRKFLSIVVLLLALGAAALLLIQRTTVEPKAADAQAGRPALGVMGTLPLFWPEAESPQVLLSSASAPPWPRTALERRYSLRPLDQLTGKADLGELRLLLLAQPRALSPAENVALDDWVRAGGRLLLFADPMLSGESRFPFGDRRRPQAVALLSPILARWGLELLFAEDQPAGIRSRAVGGIALPVAMAGHLARRSAAGGAEAACTLIAEGLAARCMIGAGRALILADATVLEGEDASEALEELTRLAFE